MNDYYVYEHIRLDNNQCFYVGKGHGNRANFSSRNEHHDRVVAKCGMKVNIIAENLTEDEAYEIERKTIEHYVFDLGYGIDIIGYNNNPNEKGHLTNHTFGGDGSYGMVHSEEWCKKHSDDMTGEGNPMYGINIWDTYSEERKSKIKNKLSESSSGINNPMYGVSPKDRMDENTYKIWKEKTQNRLRNQIGENNPNFGNRTLHNKVKDNPELRVQYYSRPGKQNGRARGLIIKDLSHNIVGEFDVMTDACQWIKDTLNINSKIDGIRSNIGISIKKNKPYRNFYFEYK